MGRILSIDYGERRIGLAISDPTATIAQPLPTIRRRRGQRAPIARLVDLAREHDVERIVVGLPIETSGEEGPQAAETRRFGDVLARRSQIPVDYWDERLTSVRARRELARMNLPKQASREKERVDAMAAVFILQSYLDARAREGR